MQFLPDQATYVDRALTRQAETSDALLADVRRAAIAQWWRISQRAEPRVLVHGDYWPGNLVWRRGRLIGVVDWEQPRLGDPSKDVATCRGDLAVLFGQEVADDFVRLYAASGGYPISNLRFWDLLVSSWALPEMPEWAVAYRVLGRPDLTSEVAVARIRAFASNALQRA
jgi:aminoglycoside phosphotransferase (APT) family kinase protein